MSNHSISNLSNLTLSNITGDYNSLYGDILFGSPTVRNKNFVCYYNAIFHSNVTQIEGYLAVSNAFISSINSEQVLTSVSLQSTIRGLGTTGYLSTPQLASTVRGLGTTGYVSTPQLASTVRGLGNMGYISTSQLTSTVRGITAGGGGSASNWYSYPALSNVNMNSNSISNINIQFNDVYDASSYVVIDASTFRVYGTIGCDYAWSSMGLQ
jgi:hypothetical protein